MKDQHDNRSLWEVISKTVYTFIKSRPLQFFLMILLSLSPALISPIKVLLEEKIFDSANTLTLGISDFPLLYRMIVAIILVQILYLVIYPIFRSHVNYFGSELETVLQTRLNQKTEKLSLLAFEDHKLYKDIELAKSTSRDLRFMVMMLTSELLLYAVQFIAVSSILFSFHYLLVLLTIIAIIPDIIAKVLSAKKKYAGLQDLQRYKTEADYFFEVLTNQNTKDIRVNNAFEFFLTNLEESNNAYCAKQTKLIKYKTKLDLFNQTVNVLSIVATYGLAIYLLQKGEISVGVFAASLGAVNTLKSNFMKFLNLGMISFDCGLKGKYYYKVLDLKEAAGKKESITFKEQFALKNAAFTYDGKRDTLTDIDFSIKKGETVAIVGKNGSGKTTLSNLMMGLYKPCRGELKFDQIEATEIDPDILSENFSAVFQEFSHYEMTLGENILMGDTRKAEFRERMEKLLNDVLYDATKLDDTLGLLFGGKQLSGGNWQKVAIARGLYRNRDILIFDESTASLDPVTEHSILDYIFRRVHGTKIVITHRLNACRLADKILLMDAGRIVMIGTHEELIQSSELYQELWESQAKWYRR